MTTTIAEQLAAAYPEQYQRIVEIAHEQGCQYVLKAPARPTAREALSVAIIWTATSEGVEYWAALS